MLDSFTPLAPHSVLLVKSSCQTFWQQQQLSKFCFFLSYGGKQRMRKKSTSHDRPGVGFLAVLGEGNTAEERRLSKLQTVPFVFINFKLKL